MGAVPDGAELRRTCDTPHCVNPLHHYLLYPRTGRALYSDDGATTSSHASDAPSGDDPSGSRLRSHRRRSR